MSYHHGDLRHELVRLAEEIILERGVDGFTLREAARRAGVSPAAPAHHFGDAKGLLTEVALAGFRDLGAALAAADRAGGSDPLQRLREQAVAYVGFAMRHPARFQLMFRQDKHDSTNPEFRSAGQQAYGVLEDAVRAAKQIPPGGALTPEAHGLVLAYWSIVHGFAHLALGGQLPPAAGGSTPDEGVMKVLLPQMLQHLPLP